MEVMTHLSAFGAGIATGVTLVMIASPRPRDDQHQENPDMHRPFRDVPLWLVAVLVSSLVLVGLGMIQVTYQRDLADRNECQEQWSRDVTDTLTTRVTATDELAAATTERDAALRAVVEVLVELRVTPPEAIEGDLREARIAYAEASARLLEVQASVEQTRQDNPYPTMECD